LAKNFKEKKRGKKKKKKEGREDHSGRKGGRWQEQKLTFFVTYSLNY